MKSRKKLDKETRLAYKMLDNFAMSLFCFMAISILGKILVHSIEVLISFPFYLNGNGIYRTMDKFADILGNNIYVIGLICSIAFFTRGVFLTKKYNTKVKKNTIETKRRIKKEAC